MDNKTTKIKNYKIKTGGITVLSLAVVCIVFFAAKSIFSSNNMEIPAGIDTGTINSNTTTAPKVTTTKKATEANAKTQKDKSKTKSETTKKDSKADDSSDESSDSELTESNEKAYVTQYANLHTEPSKDSENIVCMSPNVEVNVLEKLDNGYWKISFMNIDGPHTGYLWSGYLQSNSAQ